MIVSDFDFYEAKNSKKIKTQSSAFSILQKCSLVLES